MIFHQYLILESPGKPTAYSAEHCGDLFCGLAKKLSWFVAAVLSTTLIFMSGAGAAIQMDRLYEAEAVVEGQGLKERHRAFQDMLGEVVIRISGSREAVLFLTIIDALQKPDRFVQQYRYFQKTVEAEPDLEKRFGPVVGQMPGQIPDPITMLWVRFDRKAVINLIQKSELPVWQDTRPATLVWLAMDYGGQRYLLGNESENRIREQLGQHADRRGVPLLFPLMDLEDQQKISFTDIWGGFSGAIHAASERYGTEAVLVGRILQDRKGRWSARWNVYDTRGELQWQYASEQILELLGDGVDRLADRLGGLYAVYEGEQLHTQVLLTVSGVNSLSAYARVQQYLDTISVISNKQLVQLQDDQLQFSLELKGEISVLTQTFALKNVLAPDLAARQETLPAQGIPPQRLQEQVLREQMLQEQLLQEQLLQEERFQGQGTQQQNTHGQGGPQPEISQENTHEQSSPRETGFQNNVPVESRSVPILPESGHVRILIPAKLYYRLRP